MNRHSVMGGHRAINRHRARGTHRRYRIALLAPSALVLIALVGTAIGASPAASAYEPPDSDPFGAFSESDSYAFAQGGWLGPAGDEVPRPSPASDAGQIGDASSPSIEVDAAFLGCDSDAEFSVTYTVADPDGISDIWLSGTVGDQWIGRPVAFESGDTDITFTEVFDLEAIQDEEVRNNVWIYVEAVDTSSNHSVDALDVIIDVEDCAFYDFGKPDGPLPGDGEDPSVVVSPVVLSGCDATPTLTVSVTVTDNTGVSDLSIYGAIGSDPFDREVEFAPGDTVVTFTETVTVVGLPAAPDNRAWLAIDAFDGSGRTGSGGFFVSVDLDNCTIADVDTVGDATAPTIEAEPMVRGCPSAPELVITYVVRDSDGIVSVWFNSNENDSDVDIDPNDFIYPDDFVVGSKEISVTQVVDLRALSARGENQIFTSFSAMDAAFWQEATGFQLEIDFDACTYELITFEPPEALDDAPPGAADA